MRIQNLKLMPPCIDLPHQVAVFSLALSEGMVLTSIPLWRNRLGLFIPWGENLNRATGLRLDIHDPVLRRRLVAMAQYAYLEALREARAGKSTPWKAVA